ncbi:MAG: hypothetical protein M3Q44_07440 [bacterium]|nr:hypothetical protein [bacterium]
MTKYLIATIILVGVVAGAGAVSSSASSYGGSVGGVGNSGNGSSSYNVVSSHTTKKVSVTQYNSAFQANGVSNTINSGGNKANKNTGGDEVSVQTGTATAGVGIENTANQNAAAVQNCGCADGAVSASNKGNGYESYNKVKVSNTNKTSVNQANLAVQVNEVSNNVNTGNNQANSNTGADVHVGTGGAGSTTIISNTANSNQAVVGGGFVF